MRGPAVRVPFSPLFSCRRRPSVRPPARLAGERKSQKALINFEVKFNAEQSNEDDDDDDKCRLQVARALNWSRAESDRTKSISLHS